MSPFFGTSPIDKSSLVASKDAQRGFGISQVTPGCFRWLQNHLKFYNLHGYVFDATSSTTLPNNTTCSIQDRVDRGIKSIQKLWFKLYPHNLVIQSLLFHTISCSTTDPPPRRCRAAHSSCASRRWRGATCWCTAAGRRETSSGAPAGCGHLVTNGLAVCDFFWETLLDLCKF